MNAPRYLTIVFISGLLGCIFGIFPMLAYYHFSEAAWEGSIAGVVVGEILLNIGAGLWYLLMRTGQEAEMQKETPQ